MDFREGRTQGRKRSWNASVGQSVLALGGTVEYFRDAVFNDPTYAEAYKVAALDV
uniref:Uncharacterized protein n=1 Tax=uncultured bacterium F42-01 TaxID=1191438 RepID=I3VIL2_9BACT|nr:hypothetical protein [uncultured bacterium F42-01]